jgi:hypothetical protein
VDERAEVESASPKMRDDRRHRAAEAMKRPGVPPGRRAPRPAPPGTRLEIASVRMRFLIDDYKPVVDNHSIRVRQTSSQTKRNDLDHPVAGAANLKRFTVEGFTDHTAHLTTTTR